MSVAGEPAGADGGMVPWHYVPRITSISAAPLFKELAAKPETA